jgi:Fe-S cluster assembly protein SufD
MSDGALIEVPRDVIFDKPILLLFVSTANGQPAASYPRNLILVGRGSQASFIEGYVGIDARPGRSPGVAMSDQDGVYFTNAVTELVAGEDALVEYCKVQDESQSAFHIATLQLHQARSSSVTTRSVELGSALVREEVNAVLDGEGAECLLDGLYVTAGTQHVDNHTVIDHAKPH